MPSPRRYRAFISYSHDDAAVARRLHRALESYRVPKNLGARLRPIFRDRDELASSSSLTAEVRRALEDSDALIVVCSAASRASRWVDQEIRLFAALGRTERIYCLLTDSFDGFPLALADTGVREPLAADARAGGDGKRQAVLKLAAALLGVGFDELVRRDRQERRRTLLYGGAAFAAAMAAVATVTVWVSRGDPCPDPIDRLTGVWDAAAESRIGAAFARSSLPFAVAARERVLRELARYGERWRAMHVETCRATRVAGRQSDELFDQRMACLQDRLHDLRATTELLADADDGVIERAVDVVSGIRPLTRCANVELLRNAYPPPAPDRADAVTALGERLASVRVMADAGRYQNALVAAQALVTDAEAAGHPPLTAEALFVLGRIRVELSDPALVPTLERAAELAARARDDELLAEVWLALDLGLSQELDALDRAKALLPVARAAVARLGDAHPLNAALANQEGGIAYREGKLVEARAAFARAAAMSEGRNPRLHEPALVNLAIVSKDLAEYDAARRAASTALELAIAQWGEGHPSTAEPLMVLGGVADGEGRLEDALRFYQSALAIRRAVFEPTNPTVGLTLRALGWTWKELGRYAEAQAALEEARRIHEANPDTPRFQLAEVQNALGDLAMYRGDLDAAERAFRASSALWETYPGNPNVAIPLSNLGALLNRRGRFTEALATCERARAHDEAALGEDHPDVAFSLTCLGEALVGLRRFAEAAPLLTRAVDLRAKGKPWELGWSTFVLATARYPNDPANATALARNALELLTRDTAPDPHHVAAVRAWLAGRSR